MSISERFKLINKNLQLEIRNCCIKIRFLDIIVILCACIAQRTHTKFLISKKINKIKHYRSKLLTLER